MCFLFVKEKRKEIIIDKSVYFVNGYPHCREHGAMNLVSKYGIWRCLMCHVGYDETIKKILKDSTEGFRK